MVPNLSAEELMTKTAEKFQIRITSRVAQATHDQSGEAFTFVPPKLGRDVAVSCVVRDDDGQDVTDVRGRLGRQGQLYGVPGHPEWFLWYLVLVVDRS